MPRLPYNCRGDCGAGPALLEWAEWGQDISHGRIGVSRLHSPTTTLLPSGKVLVAGGSNGSAALNSAEVYDPASNTWSAAGSLNTGRISHRVATLLPNGKLLVAGGFDGTSALSSAEVYDPVSNTWSAGGSLNTARFSHTTTLLPSGKVLVAGACSRETKSSFTLQPQENLVKHHSPSRRL